MAQQPQQQGQDSGMGPIWVMVLLFITVFLIWKMGHQYIVMFVFQINIWQAKLVNLFIHNEELSNWIQVMQTVDPNAVNWDQLVATTREVGNFMRYPVVLVLLVLATLLYTSNITLKFRKIYDMKKLREQEQFNWPAIMPIVKEDLVAQDINKGIWAMALTPMEFARKYNLIKKEE